MDFYNCKLFLAPLAGVTETVFRRLCKRCGAGVVVSEMVSAEGILRNSRNTAGLLQFDESERPIGVQLFGGDPGRMAQAAAWVEEHVRPDFIDINAGCPAPKIVRTGGGAELLRDRPRYERMVAAMVKATSLPVTVKLRSGWAAGERVDVDYARIAQDAGAAAVVLHARTRSMLFSGRAMWERIAEIKRAVSIPIIGNGDVACGADAVRMFNETGCDGVMVGRAAMGNPWIFGEIAAKLEGRSFNPPSQDERRATILFHIRSYAALYGEKRAAAEMKKQVAWYLREAPGSAVARRRVFAASTTDELLRVVETVMDFGGRCESPTLDMKRSTRTAERICNG